MAEIQHAKYYNKSLFSPSFIQTNQKMKEKQTKFKSQSRQMKRFVFTANALHTHTHTPLNDKQIKMPIYNKLIDKM